MKKRLLIAGAIVIICGAGLLFLSRLTLSTQIAGKCTMPAAGRCFVDTSRWAKWWPKESGWTYRVSGIYYGEVRVTARSADGTMLNGHIVLAPLNRDSILVEWTCGPASRWNLAGTVGAYVHAAKIRQGMTEILDSFRSYVESPRNIYGVGFYRTLAKDSTLVAIHSTGKSYPTTAEVYRTIDTLRRYVKRCGAAAIDSPWLNVTKISDNEYSWMVALSIDKSLPGEGRIESRGFVPWKMMEGDVYGGVLTVEKAFRLMQDYRIDNNLTIMAMPFEVLLTDRRREPDTTKWVTRICAPIS